MWLAAAIRSYRLIALVSVCGFILSFADAPATASVVRPWRVLFTIPVHGPVELSCPSLALCVAVDSAGNVIHSIDPSGGASSWTAADIDAGNRLTGISCPSVSLCVAVDSAGDAVISTDPAGGAGAWTVADVDNSGDLSSVSCPSVSLCVAVDGAGNAVVSSNPAGGPSAWTVHHIDVEGYYQCSKYGVQPCQARLVGVSCPSVSRCVAVDDAGFAISSTEPTIPGPWSVNLTPGTGEYAYSAVSCASASLCVGTCAVGSTKAEGVRCGGDPLTEPVVTWNPRTGASLHPSVSANAPAGVWCRPGPVCFVSDTKRNLFASIHPASGASRWSVAYTGDSVVTGLSCPTTSWCYAVDGAGDLLAGSPPPTTAQVRALLLEHLVPIGPRARIANVVKNGGYTVSFTAPSAGRLAISWTLTPKGAHLAGKPEPVAAVKKRFANGGRVTIRIALTRGGKRLLAAARRARLTAKATFTPRGGPGITGRRGFTLSR